MKLHLDTDLGGDIDDLCALAMLLKWPGLEITGITTVAEDRGRRAGYARYAAALAGRTDIPIAAGADVSCGRYRLPVGLPREENYWPEPIDPLPTPAAQALGLLQSSITAGARIVAIGPYTNLALLDEAEPGLLATAELYLMGGHVASAPIGFPQWDNSMDFNVQSDVISASRVFACGGAMLIPIEVTAQTALRRGHLPALRASGALGRLIARQAEVFAEEERLAQVYGRTCTALPSDIINFQHDPLACAVALGWEGVTKESTRIRTEVREGWLYEHRDDDGSPATLVTAVDGARFNAFWLQTVTSQ